MKGELFPALSLDLVYSSVMSLASSLAYRGKTVALIDLISESQAVRSIAGNLESGLYEEKVGNGMIFYTSIPLSRKDTSLETILENEYVKLKEKSIDIKFVLYPEAEKLSLSLINGERAIYAKIFGEEETKHYLLVGLERLFSQQNLRELVPSLDPSKTYLVFVYERWQEYMVSSMEQRIKDRVSKDGFAGYYFLIAETGTLPISFGSSREYYPNAKLIEDLIKESEEHPITEKIRGANRIKDVIKDKKIIIISGSPFSLRDKIVETVIEALGKSNVIFLNAGKSTLNLGIKELKLMPSFADERFKGKNMNDIKKLAKRLAEEVIKNSNTKEGVVLVIYETGNITPSVLGYDNRTISYEFWNSFLNHINYNMKVSKIIFVCNPFVEACGPIEALADTLIMCREEMQNEIIIKTKE